MDGMASSPWPPEYPELVAGEPDGRTANPGDVKTLADVKPRKTGTLARPGGGESDAAFTPSPPVAMQAESTSMAMSLAHQTRIRYERATKSEAGALNDAISRNLYSQNEPKTDPLRPDSSSSASSATDWESGHATVLRRQTQNQVSVGPAMSNMRSMSW